MATYSNNTTIKIQNAINVSTTTGSGLVSNGLDEYSKVSIFVIANTTINSGNPGSVVLSLGGVPFLSQTSFYPLGGLHTTIGTSSFYNTSASFDAGDIIHKIDLDIGPGLTLAASSLFRVKVVAIGTTFKNTP